MFGLGLWELIVILVIVIMIFGASRLPQLGSGLGEGIKNFRNALHGHSGSKSEIPDKSEKDSSSQ